MSSSLNARDARPAPKGKGYMWVREDGTPLMHCRCPAELGGPHERPGGCALDRLVYSNANFLAHGNIAENIEKHVRVPMTCEPCSEADPCCSC